MMTNESKTLFIPLYGKAAMSREGIFSDKTAERIVASLPQEMEKVDTSRRLAIFMAMRAALYDDAVRQNAKIPHIIIHLGCGLDSRCERAEHGAVCWYDVDFPDVIAVRRQFYRESERYRMLPSSIMDFAWMDEIDYHGEHVQILMEGVSMYLSESDMKALFGEIQRRFGHCDFLFDAYTTFGARCSRLKNPVNKVGARLDFAMDNSHILETPQIVFSSEIPMVNRKIVDILPKSDRRKFAVMGRFYKRFYRMFRYTINPDAEIP